MPTTRQQKDFADTIIEAVDISPKGLGIAIDWIRENLDPEDVFDEKKLSAWAEENGYIKSE